jgi:G3E family GTPase
LFVLPLLCSEVGIDDALIKQKFDTEEEIFEMNNGCICCTVRGDLIRIMGKILSKAKKLDGVIIETTGLADPAPVAQTFFVDTTIAKNARLDCILTVVDAYHIIMHMDEVKEGGAVNESVQQVAFADRILLNKCDLVRSEAELAAIERRIHSINATADIIRTTNCDIPVDKVLGLHAFDLDRILDNHPAFLGGDSVLPPQTKRAKHDDHHHGDHHHGDHHHGDHDHEDHDHEDHHGEHHEDHSHCDHEHGHCEHGEHGEHGAHGAHDHHHDHHDHEDHSHCDHEHGHCEHGAHGAHDHHHDDHVSSLGLIVPGEVDQKRLNEWMGAVLKLMGQQLYRFKGVLAVKAEPKKVVFQGVHMIFTAEPTVPWSADEERASRMVFIGKDLDKGLLEAGFRACVSTASDADFEGALTTLGDKAERK